MMAKQPVAGLVKTRLSAVFGSELTAEFYRCLMLDTLALMARVRDTDLGVAFTPDEAEGYFRSLAPGLDLCRQRGSDLGAKLLNVFEDYALRGYRQIVIIGSDSPTLPARYLQRAFDSLEANDVVLGPCTDGGYYLIGARAPHPELFVEMQMSTPAVFSETVLRARGAKLKLAVLPEWYDVDLESDVLRLRAEVERNRDDTAQTAWFFSRLDAS